jgi:hypothetical protein
VLRRAGECKVDERKEEDCALRLKIINAGEGLKG